MAKVSRFGTVLDGFGVMALTAGVVLSLAGTAVAQEPTPPIPPFDAPIEGVPKSIYPSGPRDISSDFHVESTVLGFERGVGPAVGRELQYKGKPYTVADVFTADGKPCFSGGSKFTIAPAGGRLVVGLKSANPDGITVASLR